jgi:hypothetical protein
MNVRFRRRSPSRSDSSTTSSTADSSAVPPPPPWVARMDRRAANFSQLANITGCFVVVGMVLEDWDIFGIVWKYHFPSLIPEAVGGFVVAIAIALELRFGSSQASAERKIRDWYALRVAELNLETERLRRETAGRRLTSEQYKALVEKLSPLASEGSEGLPKVAVITWSDDDLEALLFANQIADAIEKAKILSLRTSSNNVRTLKLFGRYILSTPDDESRSRMAEIANSLASVGIDFKWWKVNGEEEEISFSNFWPLNLYVQQKTVLVVCNASTETGTTRILNFKLHQYRTRRYAQLSEPACVAAPAVRAGAR